MPIEAIDTKIKQDARALVKEIAQTYRDDPDTIAELLAFGSRFYQYSLNNMALIYAQNPNATYVQSFVRWKQEGYSVRKGQKGLYILVPYKKKYAEINGELMRIDLIRDKALLAGIKQGRYPIRERVTGYGHGSVFDISQTTCPPEDYPKYYSMGFSDARYDDFSIGLAEYAERELMTDVKYVDLQSIALRGQNLVGRNEIRINELLKGEERLSTLIHEIGHQLMHQDLATVDVSKTNRIEFEADAFSIMLEAYFDMPLTDARKRHIAANYRSMVHDLQDKEPDTWEEKLDGIVNGAYNTFRKTVGDIKTYIEPYRVPGERIEQEGRPDIRADDHVPNFGTFPEDRIENKRPRKISAPRL